YIFPGTPAAGKIIPGDVIISIDGHDIADDFTVEFRPKERTNLNYYIQKHQIGENLKLTLLRNGKKHKIKLSLDTAWGNNYLVPSLRYDVRPTYFIYGGLVFCPLSLNYLMTWGKNWKSRAPGNLINFVMNSEPTVKGEKVVIISKVLQSELNNGYQDYTDERIVEVNGKKIKNLKELVYIIENNKDQQYVIFKTKSRKIICFDREKVKAEQPQILKTYQIPKDRSEDLL
ncbi:MAG: PDZ domain-containing protein, partial [Deltaproteobacteria bacterium]|nr:PDZ domain-containing protein [Deltaproteobacteria bacterium]